MYSHITYLQLRNLVLARLGDSTFYTDVEVKRYVLESLRTFNALAQFNRDRTLLPTSNGVAFYDISELSLASYNLKDQDIFTDLKYALMEDATTANSWTGTSQFTLQDCQDAIEKARNEFLLRSGMVLQHSVVDLPAPPSSRVSLSDTIIEVERVAYLTEGSYIPLIRDDEFVASSFNSGWNTNPSTPYGYSVILTPKVSLQLIPVSISGGSLSIVSLNTKANCDLTIGVLLSIPDDWAWTIKWKALFYLLSKDGEATDQARADYCNQRFEEALLAARASSMIQNVFINDSSLIPTTLTSLDRYSSNWQAQSGIPSKVAIGRNLIAITPVPNGVYSLTIDMIINHPIPTSDDDFIQVGREHINAIVDYSVHLAMFKQGGSEFTSTLKLKDNLYQICMENNLRLKAMAPDFERLRQNSLKQEVEVPMYGGQ